MQTLTLVLVRHGATSWNASGYCQGHKDVPLSAEGRVQVERLRGVSSGVVFDRAFASPLLRARETASILGYEPEILDGLIEIDRGHWEGHAAEEIKRRWGKLCKGWYDDPAGLAMPGGESFDDLRARARAVLDPVEGCGGARVLVCAHQAINRVLIAQALGRPTKGVWAIPQPQAGRSVLVFEDGVWRAETIGNAEHLPAELRSES